MRTARDSVNPGLIPLHGLDIAIGYCNGAFRWTSAETARFTAAGLQIAHVDVNGTAPDLAAIVDVETGDLGPAQAPDWLRRRNAFRPGDACAYCDLSTLPGLLAATSRITFTWWLWLAHFTGKPHIPAVSLPHNVRIMGCQYLNTETYDESLIVADDWHRRAA